MSDKALRLLMVWPGGGAEHEYYQFAEALEDRIKIFLACTRVGGHGDADHDVDALLETARIDWLCEAAGRSRVLAPDCVFWACTSGSFIVGKSGAHAQVEALSELMGVPAGSTSLAFVNALAELGLNSVSVLATYPEPASRAFESFLSEHGINISRLHWMDAASGWAASALDAEMVVEQAHASVTDDTQAILIPDTAMPTLHLIERLERETGLTVLSANAVTLWAAMKLAGGNIPIDGYGSLLSRA